MPCLSNLRTKTFMRFYCIFILCSCHLVWSCAVETWKWLYNCIS